MSPLREIDIGLEGLGHIIMDHRLAVPPYQRSYAWEDRHVTDLFQDIGNAISQGESEYFLGSIVIIENTAGPRPEVVDGQQRLATTSILLAAIRDYFYMEGDRGRAADIERDYLISRHRRTQEMIPKLQLNEGDHDFYMKRILSPPDSADRQAINEHIANNALVKESHKRLLRAAEFGLTPFSVPGAMRV